MINHIAHLISAIARVTVIEESELWQATRLTLTQENFTAKGKQYRDLLIHSLTLPIKANMLNTLYHSGGNPIWIEVENPIYKYRGAEALCPLQPTQQTNYKTLAENRVMGQLLEALILKILLNTSFLKVKSSSIFPIPFSIPARPNDILVLNELS